ncbi:MAG: ThiF family adenylyltransferase [Mongoliitalea sp.]
MDRFERQYILPGFGQVSQSKLKGSSVLLIGAGGLGCPALLYLSAAGIGKIGIVDGDVVSISNLNRQVLFGQQHIGQNKATTAASIILEKYDDIEVEAYPFFLTKENIFDLINRYDVIVDGTDNFPTRYLVNDACLLAQKPLIFGAIYQNEGQVALFNAQGLVSVNYRDLYPTPPSAFEVPNCNETGVLGVLPGIIGTFMAAECIKYLSGFGETLEDHMLFYKFLNHQTYQISLSKNPASENNRPQTLSELQQIDYHDFCGFQQEIKWLELTSFLNNNSQIQSVLVDVREPHELPKLENFSYLSIPLDELESASNQLRNYQNIFLFCQSGIRSLKAVKILQTQFPEKNLQSIKGGIVAFLNS